jgi:hypothetical protein
LGIGAPKDRPQLAFGGGLGAKVLKEVVEESGEALGKAASKEILRRMIRSGMREGGERLLGKVIVEVSTEAVERLSAAQLRDPRLVMSLLYSTTVHGVSLGDLAVKAGVTMAQLAAALATTREQQLQFESKQSFGNRVIDFLTEYVSPFGMAPAGYGSTTQDFQRFLKLFEQTEPGIRNQYTQPAPQGLSESTASPTAQPDPPAQPIPQPKPQWQATEQQRAAQTRLESARTDLRGAIETLNGLMSRYDEWRGLDGCLKELSDAASRLRDAVTKYEAAKANAAGTGLASNETAAGAGARLDHADKLLGKVPAREQQLRDLFSQKERQAASDPLRLSGGKYNRTVESARQLFGSYSTQLALRVAGGVSGLVRDGVVRTPADFSVLQGATLTASDRQLIAQSLKSFIAQPGNAGTDLVAAAQFLQDKLLAHADQYAAFTFPDARALTQAAGEPGSPRPDVVNRNGRMLYEPRNTPPNQQPQAPREPAPEAGGTGGPTPPNGGAKPRTGGRPEGEQPGEDANNGSGGASDATRLTRLQTLKAWWESVPGWLKGFVGGVGAIGFSQANTDLYSEHKDGQNAAIDKFTPVDAIGPRRSLDGKSITQKMQEMLAALPPKPTKEQVIDFRDRVLQLIVREQLAHMRSLRWNTALDLDRNVPALTQGPMFSDREMGLLGGRFQNYLESLKSNKELRNPFGQYAPLAVLPKADLDPNTSDAQTLKVRAWEVAVGHVFSTAENVVRAAVLRVPPEAPGGAPGLPIQIPIVVPQTPAPRSNPAPGLSRGADVPGIFNRALREAEPQVPQPTPEARTQANSNPFGAAPADLQQMQNLVDQAIREAGNDPAKYRRLDESGFKFDRTMFIDQRLPADAQLTNALERATALFSALQTVYEKYLTKDSAGNIRYLSDGQTPVIEPRNNGAFNGAVRALRQLMPVIESLGQEQAKAPTNPNPSVTPQPLPSPSISPATP